MSNWWSWTGTLCSNDAALTVRFIRMVDGLILERVFVLMVGFFYILHALVVLGEFIFFYFSVLFVSFNYFSNLRLAKRFGILSFNSFAIEA